MIDVPTVSVVMPAYNHAAFVAESVRSVLDQDFGHLELLVSDDGSRDGTAEVVRGIRDPRLALFDHSVNRGAAVMHNELGARARGRYVAVINSDDAWMPGKLAAQVAYLEAHPEIAAVFGRAVWIDRDGAMIPKDELCFGRVFDVENRSRGEWLRHFLIHGNCLCHPTLMIRREAYAALGPYDNRMRQLPDFDMWIRLAKRFAFTILDQDMVRFRIIPGENTSSDTKVNLVRTMNEHWFIMRRFFEGVDADLLREGFADLLRRPEMPTETHVRIEKALLLLTPVPDLGPMYSVVAMTQLHDLLAEPRAREVLIGEYGFDDHTLHGLTGEALAFRPPPLSPPDLRVIPARQLADEIGARAWVRVRKITGHWLRRTGLRLSS
jgi:glycosyltransferase involved in cell wall biosynthesis